MIDEFSWFVGIYEGEGSFGSRICKRKYKDKEYRNAGIYLTIKMTDEDTIARVAQFLGQSYNQVDKKHTDKTGNKPLYRVRVMGGASKGKLYNLMQKMLPHLSIRRQEQINGHLVKALSLS